MHKRIIILVSSFVFYFSTFSMYALAVAISENQDTTKNVLLKIEHDQRPTDLEYALMSKYAYGQNIQKGQTYADLPNWKVYEVRVGKYDYQGVVFKNADTRQLVVAHRGTNPTSIGNLVEDMQSIIRSQTSPQELEAYKLVEAMVKYAEEDRYHISFTGHSLGAFLAELSVFFCHNDFNYPQANAVTFESPGSQEALKTLQPNLEEKKIPTKNLDIVGYVASPNAINTFNHHVGSVYLIDPELNNPSWKLDPTWYTRESHAMSNIVKYFTENYSRNTEFSYYMTDWPIADWSIVGEVISDTPTSKWNIMAKLAKFLYSCTTSQKATYFQYTKLYQNDQGASYRLEVDKNDPEAKFDLTYNAHYPIQDIIQKQYNPKLSLPLKHFSTEMQAFLTQFYRVLWDITKNDNDRQKLAEEWLVAEIPTAITSYLMGFQIVKAKDDSYMVVLNNDTIKLEEHNSVIPVHKFRNELSKYLQDNQEKIKTLLSSINKNFLEIDVAIVEKGAEVNEIRNSVVKGIDAVLVGIVDEAVVKVHREQQLKFIEALNKLNVKIKSRIVETGAKVGKVENVVVKGVDVGVYGENYECDAQGNCQQKKNSWF